MMMRCEELARLASERLERALTMRERASMKFHLMMCGGCRNFANQMITLREISRAYARRQSDRADPPECS